jgi:3-(3-hydroxy-phenyl)propionate hydroxylase
MKAARAGEMFPQATNAKLANGRRGRLDDLLGPGFWLITRDGQTDRVVPFAKHVDLGCDVFDESGRLAQWFGSTGAPAVLVRPDRYVFGTGTAEDLSGALLHSLAATA